jgi:hypothetical protein
VARYCHCMRSNTGVSNSLQLILPGVRSSWKVADQALNGLTAGVRTGVGECVVQTRISTLWCLALLVRFCSLVFVTWCFQVDQIILWRFLWWNTSTVLYSFGAFPCSTCIDCSRYYWWRIQLSISCPDCRCRRATQYLDHDQFIHLIFYLNFKIQFLV